MILRDPLHWVPVRYKLALTFAGVCLLAFGVGGYLVSGTARQALEREIVSRLEYQACAYAVALQGRLQTIARRTDDYASDGFIRDSMESLLARPSNNEELRSELLTHLRINKIPLEPAFHGLSLIGTRGQVVLSTGVEPSPAFLHAFRREARPGQPWFSGHLAREQAGEPMLMAVATPVTSRRAGEPLGHLVAWIYQGNWIRSAFQTMDLDLSAEAAPVSLRVVDRDGVAYAVPTFLTATDGPRADSEVVLKGHGMNELVAGRQESRPGAGLERSWLRHSFPIDTNGWLVLVELQSKQALAAVGGMQSRFLGVGIILTALASALMFFPLRFLARPLLRLAEAARAIRDGDFAARVEVDTDDEIGQLGHSFNTMAQAIEERAERLELTAAVLRQQQAQLGFERDRLEAVILSMRDGLILLDERGVPVIHNLAAAPLLEQVGQQSEGLRARHICEQQNGDDARCRACLFSPRAAPRSCVLEFGGGVYEVHSTQLRGGGGRVLVSRDLSDRIAQDERQIHQERLAVLGEVAAVMAHELNNPLAAISMYNQMTQVEVRESADLLENTEVIQRNVESCKRAIRELLDYATNATPQLVDADLNALLEDVLVFLRPLSRKFGVEIGLELEQPGEELHVSGDELQIRQIFVNLLMNAIQALGESGGHVRVSTRAEPGRAIVEVADDGPGIPGELREQIFRPFFTTKERGEGTGLGLPTSRRIAEMHGGGLELLESGPSGTIFRVRLRRPEGGLPG